MGGMLRHAIREPSAWHTTLTIVIAVLLATAVLRVRRNLLVKRLHVARAEQEARAVYG
jgi:hypothetical protein